MLVFSSDWKIRFNNVVDEFAEHKKNLAFEFQVHLTVLGQEILRDVDSMKKKSRDFVDNVFNQETTEQFTIKHIIGDKDAGSLQQNDDLLRCALRALCQVSGREAVGLHAQRVFSLRSRRSSRRM